MNLSEEDTLSDRYQPFIVGITGASGSGKTSFAHQLCNAFSKDEMCLISQDNYYKPSDAQQKDHNGVINFDLPEAFHLDEYENDIKTLKSGQKVVLKEYNFNSKNQQVTFLELIPAPIIVVEGLFIFHSFGLKQLFDIKVFVDVEDHLCLKRRILRDNEERGFPLEDVLYRYEYHVSPGFQKYIAPYKSESDLIIPNNFNFDKGLEALVAFLKTKL